MMNIKHALAVAAAVIAGPSFGITVNLTDFNFGPVIDVNVTGNQTYSGAAGEFKGSLGGAGNARQGEANAAAGASFTAYCVELTQNFSFGVNYDYKQLTTMAYFGAQKAADLSRLFTGAAGFVTNASTSGAMQAAIWEVVYEVGTSYNLNSGAFMAGAAKGIDENSFLGINAVLLNLASYNPTYQLGVLQNDSRQDFITPTIPEPGTWALFAAGLGVVALGSRRRKA